MFRRSRMPVTWLQAAVCIVLIGRGVAAAETSIVALTNCRVIDGTGAPPREGQTVVIEGGRIRAVGTAADVTVPEGARTLDMSGRTVLPGLVLLHEHFFSVTAAIGFGHPQPFSVPPLLLAYGVTTVRTAGAANAYIDLNLKQQIDAGQVPGPEMFVTAHPHSG